MSVERDATIRKMQTSIVDVISEVVPLKRRGNYYEGRCPFHDDRTPSMTVHDNQSDLEPGWFNCFGCGAGGDVYEFLQRFHDVPFLTAVRMLGGEARVQTSDLRSRPVRSTDKQQWVDRIWESREDLRPCSIVGDYLASRGIPVGELTGLDNLGETKLEYQRDGIEHPVLLAAVRDGDDNLIGIQRTYLTPQGTKLLVPSPKMSLGTIRGGAIKIGQSVDELIVTEGLEDALSLRLANPEITVWAAAGGNMMCQLPVPDECKRLVIARDNDRPGEENANCAVRHFYRMDREVVVMAPAPEFKDFNEELQASIVV